MIKKRMVSKNGGMTHTDTQYIPPKGKTKWLKSCLPVPLCMYVGLGLPVAALEHSLFGCASESCYL